MNKEEFFNLDSGDIIFNSYTRQVLELVSCFFDLIELSDIDDSSTLSVYTMYGDPKYCISLKESKNFYIFDKDSPEWVKIVILEKRLQDLESFVRERLR